MDNYYFLTNQIMHYHWGSDTAISDLLEVPRLPQPQAELWMGAHPRAPSLVKVDGRQMKLSDFIRKQPAAILGEKVRERFGGKLPFLFKVLAAAKPLSVQAHPDAEMAREGFERENAKELTLDHPERNYKDDRAKPECICALTPFWALCGFRNIPEMTSLFETVLHPNFHHLPAPLKNIEKTNPFGYQKELSNFFRSFFAMKKSDVDVLIDHAAQQAEKKRGDNDVFHWMVKIHAEMESMKPAAIEKYPNRFDPGIFAPIFLNLVFLQPGQAIFLPPRLLHSYLQGLGVELMGDSDNVVRCALTSKHIDPLELARVVRYDVQRPVIMDPAKKPNGERIYETPTEEFTLSSLHIENHFVYKSPIVRSVEIHLCTKGSCVFTFGNDREKIKIKKGDSFLIPASAENYQIRGDAELFKATIPVDKM